MNELQKSALILHTSLNIVTKIDSREREMRISGALDEYISAVKKYAPDMNYEFLEKTAISVLLNAKVNKIREDLLEDCICFFGDNHSDSDIESYLQTVFILAKLFNERILSDNVFDQLSEFEERRKEILSHPDAKVSALIEITDNCLDLLRVTIEFCGVTLSQIESAASEVSDGDYSINFSSLISSLRSVDSEKRKMISLVQIMTMISSFNCLLTRGNT